MFSRVVLLLIEFIGIVVDDAHFLVVTNDAERALIRGEDNN